MQIGEYSVCGKIFRRFSIHVLEVCSIQGKIEPPHEKTCSAICEQQKRRSACASAQSDQHLCCLLLR